MPGIGLCALLLACSPPADQAADAQPRSAIPPAATQVFLDAAVWTGNLAQPVAEAVAVRGETIAFVGGNDGARTLIGPETVVHELGGASLLPGFHDAHAHVLAGGSTLLSCDLKDERDLARLRALLQSCAQNRQYGADEWVVGNRWPLAAFENGAPPKSWLDEAFGKRPAYFVDSFGHSAWVSSRALEIAGIDALTPDPPQGMIEHDPTGAPNGTLRDDAMQLVASHIPPPSDAELEEHLRLGLAEAAKFGITAFIEPGLDARQAALYQQFDRAGKLTARVLGSLSPRGVSAGAFGDDIWPLLAQRQNLESPKFKTHSVKVYVDGVIETRTSNMLEPYTDGSNFPPFYAPQDLNALYVRLDAAGLQIHTHAIGDGAIRLALDAYAAARAANGANDNRHPIVHLQLIDEADIPRFAQLDVAASFQGLWAYPDDYIDMAIPLVGEERVQRFYPIASVQRTGGRLIGGSDWDVSSLNPLDAIETLVRRQDPWTADGPELGSGERIDLDTALAMYTRDAAWAMHLENETGSIEIGKRADLVVLDRNLFEIPATAINEAKVVLTLVGGEVVYAISVFPSPASTDALH